MTYDLTVIGGGPGGYSAAIRGAQLGLKVLLIEKDERLGGACLHRGCIPSKAYLAAAERIDQTRKAAKVGIHFGPPLIDFAKLVSSKDSKVKKLSEGLEALVKGNKIDLIMGKGGATLGDARHIKVGGSSYETRFVILATGAEPVRPAGFPFDGEKVLTTDELFRMESLPKNLLIVGGGVSGCEMACAFNLLGVQVTLVEILPEILSNEEKTASKGLRAVFEKRGISLFTGISVKEIVVHKDKVRVTLSDGKGCDVERVLVAIGRRPGADKLELTKLGVALEKGYVRVNEKMETSVDGIYAIGDLVGTTMLAHGAMAEGICAVENIIGSPDVRPIDYNTIPRVTYTIPEIASIGAKEEDLKKGVPYRVGRFSYLANGKALCHDEEEGFAQILSGTGGELEGKVLGATLFGAHAADLIQEVALVMRNKLPLKTLIDTVHAHPSLGEIIHEAAEDTIGMAIHKIGGRPIS